MQSKHYFIITAVFIFVFIALIVKYGLPPKQSNSIKEFKEYSQMIDNNIPVNICIETKSVSSFASICVKSINITNKQQLIMYLNKKYNTDIMKDLEIYNTACKLYEERYKN